jgi:hypothetical protein
VTKTVPLREYRKYNPAHLLPEREVPGLSNLVSTTSTRDEDTVTTATPAQEVLSKNLMKPKFKVFLALISNCWLVVSINGADQKPSLALRVVVESSKTEVRVNEHFKVALRVVNPTKIKQTLRVMNCSWLDHWEMAGTLSFVPWDCSKNFEIAVEIPPGGAYTNEVEMYLSEPIGQTRFSFRMGFTPIGSKKTFWSKDVEMRVIPPEHRSTWQRGTAIYRDRNGDGKIDWETSGQEWRGDGLDVYKVDANYDGFYDVKYAAGGIKGGKYWEKSIDERIPAVGKGFVPKSDEQISQFWRDTILVDVEGEKVIETDGVRGLVYLTIEKGELLSVAGWITMQDWKE